MKPGYRVPILLLVMSAASACASQHAATDCTLTATELEQVRAKAMAYLLEHSPALDARCQQFADTLKAVDTGMCAISGAPNGASGCAAATHVGYSVVFDRDSLEPRKIHFKTE